MVQIITLHKDDGSEADVLVGQIVFCRSHPELPSVTRVNLANGSTFSVKETLQEIRALIRKADEEERVEMLKATLRFYAPFFPAANIPADLRYHNTVTKTYATPVGLKTVTSLPFSEANLQDGDEFVVLTELASIILTFDADTKTGIGREPHRDGSGRVQFSNITRAIDPAAKVVVIHHPKEEGA